MLERTVDHATPAALTALRHEVHHWAWRAGFDQHTTEDISLAVYEALTNAVDHAYPPGASAPLHLTAVRRAAAAEVVVSDHGTWRAPPVDPGDRGRGVHLMHALAGRTDIATGPGGTTVTLRWPLPDPGERAAPSQHPSWSCR